MPAPATLDGKTIASTIQFNIKDVTTGEKNTPGVIEDNDKVIFELSIQNIVIKKMALGSEKTFFTEDEADFNIGSDEVGTKSNRVSSRSKR